MRHDPSMLTRRLSAVVRIYTLALGLRRRSGTFMWRLLHLPFATVAPGASVSLGVRVYPMPHRGRLKIRLASGSRLMGSIVVQGAGELTIGSNSYLGSFSVIVCNERIEIGEDVMMAQAVTIRDTDHASERTDLPMIRQGIVTAAVVIGDDVWVGHGVTILKGVTIGSGSVITAGAVVNEDVPAGAVVGGVPARVLKFRGDDDESPVRTSEDRH